MYYKVFIGSVELAFVKKPIRGYQNLTIEDGIDGLENGLAEIRDTRSSAKYYIIDIDGSKKASFLALHNYIEAAGGLVENEFNELLVIERLGKLDLPKGKIEAGEKPDACALREVQEECGITNLELIEALESTYHTYPHKGKHMLKRTYWYLMKTSGIQRLKPQVEEDITKVDFLKKQQVEVAIENTYASLVPLFNAYLARHE